MAVRSGNTLADRLTMRLSHSLLGTNSERTGDYNQRAVLHAIRRVGETTRTKIAAQTGLSVPTVVGILARLIKLGLVVPLDNVRGRRGQPAKRIGIAADGAYGVGLNIDRDHLTLVILDLAGDVRWRRTINASFRMPSEVVEFVTLATAAGLDETGIDHTRVLGLGVAIPNDLGRIHLPHQPVNYCAWNEIDLPALFHFLGLPVYVDNDAAAAAIGEAQSESAFEEGSFFYLLISAGLGGGLVIDRNHFRGATGRSGEIGLIPMGLSDVVGATVQDVVSISALDDRLAAVGATKGIEHALELGTSELETVIDLWVRDAAHALVAPLTAVTCLLNPGAVVIGGRLPEPLIARLVSELAELLGRSALPFSPMIRLAAMADYAPALGAAVIPFLHRLLPSDGILIRSDLAQQSDAFNRVSLSDVADIGALSLRPARVTSRSVGGAAHSPSRSSMTRSFTRSVIFSRTGMDDKIA